MMAEKGIEQDHIVKSCKEEFDAVNQKLIFLYEEAAKKTKLADEKLQYVTEKLGRSLQRSTMG